jgi:hypothetical protein
MAGLDSAALTRGPCNYRQYGVRTSALRTCTTILRCSPKVLQLFPFHAAQPAKTASTELSASTEYSTVHKRLAVANCHCSSHAIFHACAVYSHQSGLVRRERAAELVSLEPQPIPWTGHTPAVNSPVAGLHWRQRVGDVLIGPSRTA